MGKRIYRNQPSNKEEKKEPTMEELMQKIDVQENEPANVAKIIEIGGGK